MPGRIKKRELKPNIPPSQTLDPKPKPSRSPGRNKEYPNLGRMESQGIRLPVLWWKVFKGISAVEGRDKQKVIRGLIEDSLNRSYPQMLEQFKAQAEREANQ